MHATMRPIVDRVFDRLTHPPPLLQVVVGPRQVGKTTAARAIAARWEGPVVVAAADELFPPDAGWIAAQWDRARRATNGPALLVLDEVQKVPAWSDAVKGLWDADRAVGRDVRVLLLGSSALLLAHGTHESLAGRYFLHRFPHWGWPEVRDTFGWDLDRWLFFGGYPGAAPLAADEPTWRSYVRDALIEPTIARDVLSLRPVSKPTLLRHLFALSCLVPAQALSYNKMLGELHDAGNTSTLADYLHLLEQAFLVSGLEKYSGSPVKRRGSSPKLVVWNNALVSAVAGYRFEQARDDRAWWGRLVENAVGGHLVSGLQGVGEVGWWRDRDQEVDFVVTVGLRRFAIEVKSGRRQGAGGVDAFTARYPGSTPMIVGTGGIPLEEFFSTPPATLFSPR